MKMSYSSIESYDYRVRYSPYAFSYNTTGLVPGGIRYSPYAFEPGQSGLVYEGTRYTPYAFSYDNPGLVVDYSTYPIPICPVQVVVVPCPAPNRTSEPAPPPDRESGSQPYGRAGKVPQQIKPSDPTQTIRQYLAGRGFKSVDMNYLWRIEGKVAGVSFVVRGKGLAIRYTDPDIVASLAPNARKNATEQAWEVFAKSFTTNGGSVYSINVSGKDQIVAALDNCEALRPQDGAVSDTVMVAKD
jgi:hypothetical protein